MHDMLIPPEQLIKQILTKNNNSLATLVNRSQVYQTLNHALKCFLDKKIQPHCRIYDYKDNCLILATDSPHWHLRLRCMTADLLSYLRNEKQFYALATIKIIVQPENNKLKSRTTTNKQQTRDVPTDAAEGVSSAADGITDESLKAQLQQLAKTLEQS